MSCNGNSNCFDVIKNIFVAETNHSPAFRFDPCLPREIIRVNVVVIPTVDFDDELLLDTHEIHDEWSDWILTSS